MTQKCEFTELEQCSLASQIRAGLELLKHFSLSGFKLLFKVVPMHPRV